MNATQYNVPKFVRQRLSVLQRYGLALGLTVATGLAAANDQDKMAYTLGGMTLAATAVSALRRDDYVLVRRQ